MSTPERESRIGPYVLEALLGRGGMGAVHRARAPDGSRVALKTLRSSLTHLDALRRFQREAAIRVVHPNVVRVLDAGADTEGTPYIALELLEGETLAQRLATGGTLSVDATIDLGIQLCRGIGAAHREGIVHRDLKPSNVFLARDGLARILDFGVSWLEGAEAKLTESGQVLGTLDYLAPEQAERRGRIDHRIDLWAIGVVLYEALAGHPPFAESSPMATVVAIMLAEPPSISARRSDVPRALEAVVRRALQKSPDHRWASAEAFETALVALRDPDGMASSSPTIPPDQQRVVALLYASGVRDAEALERAIHAEHGAAITLPNAQILGVFGASSTIGDEATRAARAGIVARTSAERIAIGSGRASSTSAGLAGTALEAARRCAGVAVTGVAISGDVARALPRGAPMRAVSADVLELAATVDVATALVGTEPDESELLGREPELAMIARAISRARDERRATCVWITGPPGIGKSHLRTAAERLLETSGPPFVRLAGRVEPHGPPRHLAVLRTMLRQAATQAGGNVDPGVLAREAYSARDEIAAATAAFARLLECATDERAPEAPIDLQLAEDRAQVAIVDWVLARCDAGPFALVLEDLHWEHRSTFTLLERLLAQAEDRPLLVLATARSELAEARPDLFSDPETVRVTLRGLDLGSVRRLAERIAGAPLDTLLVERIAARSGGNPFFVEQIVRALSESIVAPDALPLPPTIEAALQARLDALPSRERDLCRRGAVFQRAFSPAEVAALGAPEPVDSIRELRARGLLVARGRDRYDFCSDLLAEFAYRMISDEARAALHARAAQVLADAGADPEDLALHHERSGAVARAAELQIDAMRRAIDRGDASTILRTADAALRLGAPDARLHEIAMARAEALRFLGERIAQGRALDDALRHARTDVERARALGEQCVHAARSGRTEDALALGQRAAEAAASADATTRTLALGRWMLAALQAGRVEMARTHLEAARQAATGSDERTRALTYEWAGQLAAATGDLDGRRKAFAEAAELHRRLGDPRRSAGAECNVADVENRVGAYEAAIAALEAARQACRRVGHRTMEGYALLNLGYARAMLGELETSSAALRAAGELADAIGEVRLQILVCTYRARTALFEGRHEDAWALASRAAVDAGDRGMASAEIAALTLRGAAAIALGRADEALLATGRALARLDELGGIEEDEIEVYLTRARALVAAGSPDEAAAVRARGRARMDALASAISDPAMRASFLARVPAHVALAAEG